MPEENTTPTETITTGPVTEPVSTEPEALESPTKEIEDALYKSDDSTEETQKTEGEKTQQDEEPTAEEKPEEANEAPEDDKKEEESESDKKEVEYSLKLKDNSLLGDTSLKQMESFAKEQGLSPEQAQSVLEYHEQVLDDYLEAEDALLTKNITEWRGQIEADPELGGDNLEEVKNQTRTLVQNFGDKELVEILESSGYADHPAVVRFLYGISGAFTEEALIMGKRRGVEKTVEQKFYG